MTENKKKRPIVFISYSHDSEEHKNKVLGLCASLSRDDCDCRIDITKSSDEDWPLWMTNQLEEADFVLCVVTETYRKRFRNKELPEFGLGVGWEAGIIRRLFYKTKLGNSKVFPILFDSLDKDNIPIELDTYEYFNLETEGDSVEYKKLLHKIYNKPEYKIFTNGVKPDLETIIIKPGYTISDTNHEDTPESSDGVLPEPLDVDPTKSSHEVLSEPPAEELRKECQNRQFPQMVAAIKNKRGAEGALAESLKDILGEAFLKDDVEVLVKQFNKLSDKEGLDCITKAFIKLRKENNKSAVLEIGGFAAAWLPVIYKHHRSIRQIRDDINNTQKALVNIPTKLGLATEITMAEVDKRVVNLEITAENEIVLPLNLGSLGEPGLDDDGKEQHRQLYNLLTRRFSKPSEVDAFEKTLDNVVLTICKNNDPQRELEAKIKKETLNNILTELHILHDLHYYFCVDVDSDADSDLFKTLKSQYPALAFLVNNCTDPQDEANHYRRLSNIIAFAKNADSHSEEMA